MSLGGNSRNNYASDFRKAKSRCVTLDVRLIQPLPSVDAATGSEASGRRDRAKVIPFPGNPSTEPAEDALAAPSSVFIAQVLGQRSEPRATTNAFERGIAAYEATTSRTDAFIGATPPVELRT